MSKRQTVNDSRRIGPVSKETAKHIDAAMGLAVAAALPTLDKPADSIPWFRRCPLCWDGNGGVGNCYTTNGSTRYYKCCQSINPDGCFCGHTWTALVRTEVIKVESRTVHTDSR